MQELESRLYELFTAKVFSSGHPEIKVYLDDKDVLKAMFHAFVIGWMICKVRGDFMKRVQLKIEELFDNQIIVAYSHVAQADTEKIIANKIYALMDGFLSVSKRVYVLKDGESRQSIILALWKLQREYIGDIPILTESTDGYKNKYYIGDTFYNFYDPKTRIITITSFDKELTNNGFPTYKLGRKGVIND